MVRNLIKALLMVFVVLGSVQAKWELKPINRTAPIIVDGSYYSGGMWCVVND